MKICILCDYVEKVKVGKAEDVIADQEPLLTAKAIKEVLEKKGHQVKIVKIESLKIISSLKKKFDFVFNLAEGIKGNEKLEPEIAAAMEKHKIPFTGSKKKALLLCLDKANAKKVLIKHKIPTPRSELFKSEKAAIHLDFPMIVKPVHEDGGIGISGSSVVHDESALRKKVKEILTIYKQPALVEEFIDGREVSVSVIGNGKNIEILPLFELVFNFPPGVPKIRSYESKWIEDSMEFKQTHHKVPAEIDKKTADVIRKEAIRAYKLTGCHDYARIDFRLKGNKPYVLEINPNPCLYPVDATLVFCAKAAGYTYDEIILKIFEIARKRYK